MLQEKQGKFFLRVVLNKYFLIGQLFCFLIKLKKEKQSFKGEFILESLISIFSLVISFALAYRVFFQERASISLFQDHNASRSYSFSFDGWSSTNSQRSQNYPDTFSSNEFRLLSEVLITNNSSLPISIISFTLNDTLSYDSYVEGGNYYLITLKENSKVCLGSPNSPINYLKPNFTIDPYTTVRGNIFFNLNSFENLFKKDTHDLKVLTSRGVFNFKLDVPNHYETIRPSEPFRDDEFPSK